MPIYVAMLRGINVGAHKRIRMDELRQSFEALGFKKVQTYIQSGNVIFETAKASTLSLSNKIEQRIVADFGFAVSVVARTGDEMSAVISNNPFVKQSGIELEKLHVMFLSAPPGASALKALEGLTVAPDRSLCLGKEIYLHLPNGVSESSLMKGPLDRKLSVVTTTRNWKTVNTLHQMCKDCG